MSDAAESLRKRLRELAHEINLLATKRNEDRVPEIAHGPQPDQDAYRDTWWLGEARRLREFRRLRAKYFPDYFFGEPAWNMMIDLFIEDVQGRRVSISSACIASDVPETTALRWINILQGEGIVERQISASDKRRTWLMITPKGRAFFKRYILELNNLPPIRSPEFMLIQSGEAES